MARKAAKAESVPEVAEPLGPGRPPGSPNRDFDIVEAHLTKCRRCGSTSRSAYQGRPEKARMNHSDKTIVIIWRRCKCLGCGQWRKDKYQVEEPPQSSNS